MGAVNAVTQQANGNRYRAIWAASTTSRYHADELNKSGGGWNYTSSDIKIPICMVAGTNLMDAGIKCGKEIMDKAMICPAVVVHRKTMCKIMCREIVFRKLRKL